MPTLFELHEIFEKTGDSIIIDRDASCLIFVSGDDISDINLCMDID